jgi:OFA family oxalate/formate antiporter-like MFS transporter
MRDPAGLPDVAILSSARIPPNRWVQLAIGVACMAMIANLQYGWTLFVDPIAKTHHWLRADVQVAFTIFVVTETWLVPVEAWFVDRFGPRPVILLGAVLIGSAWVINAVATTLAMLYLGAVVGGIGAGCVYGTCVGSALKWFPDKRGLAAGATAAGFGAGAAVTVVPIAAMINADGYQHAFLIFGIGQGLVVAMLAMFIERPAYVGPPVKKRLAIPQSTVSFEPRAVVRQPVFWVLYACFTMVAAGGLMTAAQIGPIAHDFGIAGTPVSIAGFTMAALTFAISLDRILDGFGRPLFGFISDRIGREHTMGIAFSIAALMLLSLAFYGANPLVFVLASAVFFGVFGEIYSLFPATCGDTFGSRFATTNAGMLYTAKGMAALVVPFASVLAKAQGWYAVFTVAVCLNAAAALIALFILKPMRLAFIDSTRLKLAAAPPAKPAVEPELV